MNDKLGHFAEDILSARVRCRKRHFCGLWFWEKEAGMTQRVLINGSNLHAGGGVQVAASVVSELARSRASHPNLFVAISSEVSENIEDNGLSTLDVLDIATFDIHAYSTFNYRKKAFFNKFDRVLTIFGPLYRWSVPFVSIVGFAQPWIIYPRNEVYRSMSLLERLRTRLKFWIKAQFFKRADVLIVELEHVKDGLVRELGIDPARIHVIRNCVSNVYRDPTTWRTLKFQETTGALLLGFLGRNYRHKNTKTFPDIISHLRMRHKLNAKVVVTFTEAEWSECSVEFRDCCINLGPLTAAECPNFYRALDAVLLPSLLECFSATPLEAMAMYKPVFVADRPFNRDICGDHAVYFDPLSPRDAADQIAKMFTQGGGELASLQAAREHALTFSTPEERAEKYLNLLYELQIISK